MFRFVAVVQLVLLLVHLAVYGTLVFFWGPLSFARTVELRAALALLAISFVGTSFLARRYFNFAARMIYAIAALWLGVVTYFFLAACVCWIVYLAPLMFGVRMQRRPLAGSLFGVALLLGIYAIGNAARIRVKKITVKLPNLPASWRGRTAALVSDLHLGHIRNRGFLRRIVGILNRLQPDVLFIPGDLYDGVAIDAPRLAEPWAKFSAPLGSYFVTGNHEQFSSSEKYLDAVKLSGIRTLKNEKIILDGLQIVGVDYRDSTSEEKFRAALQHAGLDRDVASILLVHTPDRLRIAAEAGFSLQLSGHTHRGQFFPFTLIVSRIYGEFAYGLHRFGGLAVYTSSGAGTWGPPMRLGTFPEIVLIHFE
ncbi:MAG TPA: metallophosphoesterase [Candidatus Dormibacteraeota bacterium]|nr:metallophosphoesterase [Candidatus Dormibacteraeota bacterium]